MWSGDVCVALAGGEKRAQDAGDHKGSLPTQHHPALTDTARRL
jgi:hypothetical protein